MATPEHPASGASHDGNMLDGWLGRRKHRGSGGEVAGIRQVSGTDFFLNSGTIDSPEMLFTTAPLPVV